MVHVVVVCFTSFQNFKICSGCSRLLQFVGFCGLFLIGFKLGKVVLGRLHCCLELFQVVSSRSAFFVGSNYLIQVVQVLSKFVILCCFTFSQLC